MSAYRNGAEKRGPRSDPPERARPRLLIALSIAVVVVLSFTYFFWKQSPLSHRQEQRGAVSEDDVASVAPLVDASGEGPTPTRAIFSEQNHLAIVAAISIANAASAIDHDEVTHAAMAVADALTESKTTCSDLDAAFAGLQKAIADLPDAGAALDAQANVETNLPADLQANLEDIDRARCTLGSGPG